MRVAVRIAVATAILGFAPGLLEPFHPFKASLLRAAGLALLGWVALEALAGRLRAPGAAGLAALAWAAAGLVATLLSTSPRLSLLGELSQREGVLLTLALVGLHLAAAHSHRGERDVRLTLKVVLASACVSAVYAQLQLAGLDPIAWEGLRTFTVQGATTLRPGGTLGNPILLGTVLAAALPIAIARLAEPRSEAVWYVPVSALLAATLVATLSRGPWLAGAVGVGVTVAFALAAGAPLRRVSWTLAASLSPAVLFVLVRSLAPVAARIAEGMGGGSTDNRAVIASGALQLWSERAWTGVGPDAFGLAFPRVQAASLWRNEWIGVPMHAHSVPLQTLATLGAIGAAAGLAWLLASAFSLRDTWRAEPSCRPTLVALVGLFAALLVAGSANVVGLAGATLFAVVTALAAPMRTRAHANVSARRFIPTGVSASLAAMLCLFELSAGSRELRALSLARPARESARRADSTPSEWRAMTSARAASVWRGVALWPDDEALWRLACDASLAEGAAWGMVKGDSTAREAEAAAEHAARRALHLVPARAANMERLGNALAARALRTRAQSTADSAVLFFERAAAAAPADGWLLVSHVRFHLARRDAVRAFELGQQLTGLYPEAAVGHTLTGAALLMLRRYPEARVELLLARASRWESDAGAQRVAVDEMLAQLPARSAAGRPTGRTSKRR